MAFFHESTIDKSVWRELFAAMALHGLLMSGRGPEEPETGSGEISDADWYAKSAYQLADAMLRARK